MPLETVEAFQDHGTVALTLEEGIDEARSLLRELGKVGVDVDDVTETLEEEGVQKFADSFQELLDGIRAKRGELVSAPDAHRAGGPRAHGRQHGRAPAPARSRGRDVRAHRPGADRHLARGARLEARAAASRLADGARRRRDRAEPTRRCSGCSSRATCSSTAATRTSATRSAGPRGPRRRASATSTPACPAAIWGLEGGYCVMVGGERRGLRGDRAALPRPDRSRRLRARRARRAPATSRRWSTTGSSTG